MSDSTRRSFLAVAGTGAVAAGALAVAPNASAAAESDALPAGAEGTMVAYIKDVKNGELVVMSGEDEVVVTDKVLVSRLAHAFARASRG